MKGDMRGEACMCVCVRRTVCLCVEGIVCLSVYRRGVMPRGVTKVIQCGYVRTNLVPEAGAL